VVRKSLGTIVNITLPDLQFIYEEGFRHRYIGYASAVTVVFTIFLIVVSLIIKRVLPDETN